MNEIVFESIPCPHESPANYSLLGYVHSKEITEFTLNGALRPILNSSTVYQSVIFVGTEEHLEALRVFYTEKSTIFLRLLDITQRFIETTRFLAFDETNGQLILSKLDKSVVHDETLIKNLRNNSLLQLFKLSNALLSPPEGFHYIKPSGKHSENFLMTSNILENASNIKKISFWLLPYIWNKDIEHIVVDTTGICGLACTLSYEAYMKGATPKLCSITSHQSYVGLSHLEEIDSEKTFFLVSASTSGELVKELISKGAKSENIVTLFFLSSQTSTSEVLCDLSKEYASHNIGYKPFESYQPGNCPLCLDKSLPLKFEGDRFILDSIKTEKILISNEDLSPKQKNVFETLCGINLFQIYRRIGDLDFEIYIEVEKMFPQSPFTLTSVGETTDVDASLKNQYQELMKIREKMVWRLRRGISINTSKIIVSKYPYSKELGDFSQQIISENIPSHNIPVVTSDGLIDCSERENKASLVITSCLDNATELLKINRLLRDKQPNGNTTYITSIFRGSSEADRKRIKSNLTYGENGADTFTLYSSLEIDLPTCSDDHSWKCEYVFLRDLLHWSDLNELAFPKVLQDRLTTLELAPKNGLSDNLFWDSSKGVKLKIKSNFVFLDTYQGHRNLTQSDIYAVVSCILLNLRNGTRQAQPLGHRPYLNVVLEPDNFITRYSDAVLQAAFLRAARGQEMVYLSDKLSSLKVKEHILHQINNWQSSDADALMEYFIAIAIKKLVLLKTHLKDIFESVSNSDIPDEFKFVIKFLKQD